LFFFISTKMMPAVAAVLPVYLLTVKIGMKDNIWTMVILYTSMNLPLAIWMMRSFLLEVPREVLEAGEVDGAGLITSIRRIILPIVSPGLAATALICFIFTWNEFFLAVNLTDTNASTAPIFLLGFISGRGPFLADLSAAATLLSLPVLLAGWVAQNKLVRGLSMGAVK
jgi:sorbitol/mannitol transport system permease protein